MLPFISSHLTFETSTLSRKPPHSYDFMLTQKFTSSVWPSVQISWTVCMILSVLFCFGWTFSCGKTSSYCIHSLTFHSCDLGLFAVFPRIFSFFTLLGGFFFYVLILPYSRIKVDPLVSPHLVPHGILVVEKKNLIIIFLIFMFCAIRLKLNIPTFYTTGNKRQQNLFLPSYVLFIIFALCRQPHSVSRKLCVKEWPLPPPLHPWSHLYFCAFLHRHVCLNADGIKRLLLPQSISVFLFVATDQSHLTHALIAK